MSYFPDPHANKNLDVFNYARIRLNLGLDLSNYAIKSDLKRQQEFVGIFRTVCLKRRIS